MAIHSCLKKGAVLALTAMAAQAIAAPATVQNRQTSLPTPRQISYFGERAAWSADGKKLAFMDKSFGDAFQMDMDTMHVTLLTHYPNAGYLRAQYLNNGDLFLIGARTWEGEDKTRDALQEMWVVKNGSSEPVALNRKIWEGVAISRKPGSTKIAWANNHDNYPCFLQENETAIYTGDVVNDASGNATLVNITEVLRAKAPDCTLEPQDFFDNDNQLTYTCYNATETPQIGSVRGINLQTKEVTLYRFVARQYSEVEGIMPDGKYTMVESGKDQPVQNGDDNIDIWRLRLEPNSQDFVRLTDFGDHPVSGANKASNPVVSPDGKTMAFQGGHSGDAAGVGYGIFLLDLPPEV
ncbi:hypothetical protein F5884DRAFT_41137 [Xylogone sp. PMI_703]|nr:hypothetical protein F5884DRAFT_41137 [Xylogone sp. PMI_703]